MEESERLKKTQGEVLRQSQQLEVSLRELQERLAQLESGRLGLEQEKLSLQTSLQEEKRERRLGSETINELQGGCMCVCASLCSSDRSSCESTSTELPRRRLRYILGITLVCRSMSASES